MPAAFSPVKPFVVLFLARSGSTLLTGLLKDHPEISMKGEILVGHRNVEKQHAAARRAWMPETDHPVSAAGFKTKLVDVLDLESFGRMLSNESVLVIHLQRRNHVKRVISFLNARRLHRETGKWNAYPERKVKAEPLIVDPIDFDKRLRRAPLAVAETAEMIRSLGLRVVDIFYEDLFVDRSRSLELVFDALGVSRQPLTARTIKNTPDDLREVIKNFDVVHSQYVGTEFEWMFDEVL